MTETRPDNTSIKKRWASKPAFWMSLAALAVAGLLLANAHLVIVAVSSQPGCVPHDKIADSKTAHMRAAKSGC